MTIKNITQKINDKKKERMKRVYFDKRSFPVDISEKDRG
jgi:hypothetical protein